MSNLLQNILVLDDPDPNTGLPRVKLLDFGLSKEAGHNGSAGKSFVGTPCYLAPEVEYTSHGQGGVYGLAADCWSLGALLHVMLVARFPEFERDRKGIVSLVLPSKYWREISVQARDLVKSLMEPNSFARLTIKEVMEHPWQGIYRTAHTRDASIAHGAPPPPPSVASTPEVSSRSALGLPRENAINSLVVKAAPRGTISDPPENADGALTLGPLLNLQRSIALCFEDALSSYADYPEVATQIYKGAVMCRKQLMDSTKMLRKVEQTASSVLELFPDLELAVEEGAPQLAADFFSVVRSWVIELRDTVTTTQLANHESMLQIHAIIHESTVGLNRREASSSANLADSLKSHLDQSAVLSNIKRMQGLLDKSGGGSLTSDQIFELFMSLFNSAVDQTLERRETDETTEQGDREGDREGDAIDVGVASSSRAGSALSAEDSVEEMPHPTQSHTYVPGTLHIHIYTHCTRLANSFLMLMRVEDSDPLESNLFNQVAVVGSDGTRSAASAKLVEALYKLRQVDLILEQLSVFWANTEVVLDVLAKKGQHAEQFIAFANKPRLLSRFKERLAEYSQFWIGVRDMCSKYVSNVQPQAETKIRLYEFLEKESSKDSSSMSEQLYGSTLMNRNASTVSSAYATPDRGVGINSSERFDKVDSI